MTKRLSKSDLIATVADNLAVSKSVTERVVNAFLDELRAGAMAGSNVVLIGFGTFSRRDKPERMGHNPATGEAILLAASQSLAFRASKKPGAA